MRCSGHVPLGGDPGEDPGHVGETVSRLAWERLGVPPGRAGGSGRGQGRLGFSAQAAAPATRPPEKRQIMDGEIKESGERTPVASNRVTNCCICGEKRKETIHGIISSTCTNINWKKRKTNSNNITSSKYMRRKINRCQLYAIGSI